MAESVATAVSLLDLLDIDELAEAIEQGFVRRQVHPVLPLEIYNYTERCQYERAWTDITRMCRGLIVNRLTREVLARPFGKFFNYGGHPDGSLDLLSPAEVTDKMDGSLGILYPVPDGWAIATRGSFTSEQAMHATAILRDRYPDFEPPDGMTALFEIIYPANRIVVDYGSMDDLVLLGAADIATGRSVGPDWVSGWDGPATETMAARTLADALTLPPRAGQEGIVVRMGDGTMIKLKQDDYVVLHRILTQTTARTVWEFLAVGACKHLISQPKHWGSRIGLDPQRAAEILAIGDGWMDKLLDGVPDEFHAWLHDTMDGLIATVHMRATELAVRMAELGHPPERKDFAAAVKGDPDMGVLFLLYDGKDITANLWRGAYPEPGRPFADHGEDVA